MALHVKYRKKKMNSGHSPVTMTDADFEAQTDARALAQAEIIKSDAGRLKRASMAARKLAPEEAERAAELARIASVYRRLYQGAQASA